MQTTKELAARIDPTYIHRPSRGRFWRRILIVLFTLSAGAWWWSIGKADRRQMLSPGHVSMAHALWENDCEKCHDPDNKGGFLQTIKDEACLQCHTAAAHHPDQLLRTGGNSKNPLALAVSDGPHLMRSAECVACHIEHRGRKSLTMLENETCTQCHKDLKHAVQPTTAPSMANVTEFNDIGGHPYFGSKLLVSGKSFPTLSTSGGRLMPPTADVLKNPTPLRFNHGNAEHLKFDSNCSLCHSSKDEKYVRPIYSFANSCGGACHTMKLPGGMLLPHARMELVLAQVASANDAQFRQGLTEWAGGLKEGSLPGAGALETELIKLPDDVKIDPDLAGKNAHLVTAYIAYGINQNCAKCHEIRPTEYGIESNPILGTITPADSPAVTNVPTGIADAKQHWFMHGAFDHRGHQNMSCNSCHARPADGDIPVPNIVWKSEKGEIVSCAMCHHPSHGLDIGVRSDCVDCHRFHEPTLKTAEIHPTTWPAEDLNPVTASR